MKYFVLLFPTILMGTTSVSLPTDQNRPINISFTANMNSSNVAQAQQSQQEEQRLTFVQWREYAETAWKAVKDSRRAIILSALGICYVSSLIYFLRGRFLINDTHAWHAWRSEISLNEFLSLPHKNLYEQLRLAMQERYHTPNASIMMNLFDFFNETTHELAVLRSYHAIGSRLARVWLAPVFFVTQDSLYKADEKIKRLLHMRTVIANELEPDDVLKRLRLINCAILRSPTLMQDALSHRR